MYLSRQAIQKSLGPGILLAGAAIGGSHLLSSTTAGARFGFGLVGLILITNLLKYPFLLVGTRFTSSTGKSLLEGFKERNSVYLPIFVIVSLITGTFTIAAVSFVSGVLLTNIPLFSNFPAMDLSIGILVVCGLILLVGEYRALDRISKFLVALLTFLTLFAVISLLTKGSINESLSVSLIEPEISPWKLSNLSFNDKYGIFEVGMSRSGEIKKLSRLVKPHVGVITNIGEAHIIRNAGGRVTDDAIRSLIISYKLLGTKDWFIIQHTDCGLSKITDEEIAGLSQNDLETSTFENGNWKSNKNNNSEAGSAHGQKIKWYTFSNLKESILEDLEKIKNHPLIPKSINVYGFVYDVKTGKLESIEPSK